MSRRPLHAALTLALAWANGVWVGPSFGQSTSPAAQHQAVQTVTVMEPGHAPEKCMLLQAWQLADGSAAMKVKSLASGEIMTVVEPVNSQTEKDRFRVYRWGKSVVPPAGSPLPPNSSPREVEARQEPVERKWPSAHETAVKPKSGTKSKPATTARPETPVVPTDSTAARKAGSSGNASALKTAVEPRASAPAVKDEPKLPAPVVAQPAPREPWTASTRATPSRKPEVPAGERALSSKPKVKPEPQEVGKAETPARLAAAATASPTPASSAMDHNPAVPASVPVAPPLPPTVSPPLRAPEPPVASPISAVAERKPAEEPRPSKTQAAKEEVGAASRAARANGVRLGSPDLLEKPAEKLSPPPAPGEQIAVSRTRPAVSLLPDEPPTPIMQTSATDAGGRSIGRPTPPPLEKQSAKPEQGSPLDYGQVVSRTAPALPASVVQVVPRRVGPDPLANPDQYVRLNKRDRDERTPTPATTRLPSSALAQTAGASPARAPGLGSARSQTTATESSDKRTSVQVGKAEPRTPDVKQASAPVAATPTGEKEQPKVMAKAPSAPKREVVQASAKGTETTEVKKTDRPEPTLPSAPPRTEVKMHAPPPAPALERVDRKEPAVAANIKPQSRPQAVKGEPRIDGAVRQVALAAPARAQMVRPMPLADVSTVQGMVDLMKVLSDSGVPAHRQKAASDLGALDAKGHPYVVEALASAAKRDDAAQVRVACIHSLKQMRSDSPTVKAAFQTAVADADPRVREAAAEALRVFPAAHPAIQPVTGFSP